MERRVVRSGALTVFVVVFTFDNITDMQCAFDIFNMMQRLFVRRLLNISDICFESIIPDSAGICTLSAALCIEACFRENDIALIFQFIDLDTVLEQSQYLAGRMSVSIACEF